MTGGVVAVVLFFLKVYVCQAENVIIGSTKQLVCPNQNGNGWDKLNDVSYLWETITDGDRYSGSSSKILTIVNFQIKDSGYFRCMVNGIVIVNNMELKPEANDDNNIKSTNFPAPDAHTNRHLISNYSNICKVQASIGSPVTLTCTVLGTPIYWYIIENNSLRTLSDNDKYEGSRTIALKIKSLTANTAAVYYCLPQDGPKGPEITVSISEVTGWSSWNEWSACNASCGGGQRQRLRTCLGGSCEGSLVGKEDCTVDFGVNGSWSTWFITEPCTVSCGGGLQKRLRLCNSPQQSNCGLYCNGEDNDYIPCSLSACPVNGGWSFWTSGACNVTCGTGQHSMRRFCNNPLKANGGADCQGEEYGLITCTRSECSEKQSGNTAIVVGTVIGVLVIVLLILILVIYAKRRKWYKSKKEPDYEITDMTKVKSHIYGKTHVNHAYQNEQQSAEVKVFNTENYINEAHLVERYDVSELTKRCQNKEYFLQSLKAEFRLLNNSTDDSKPFNSQYEIVNTGLRQDVNQLHLDSSTLGELYTDNVSILLEPPQKDIADQFWTIVDNQCVENIILLAKENEKISEFYPMLDDVMRINNFEIYLDSAERMNKHIMLLIFNLQNKTTQSIRQIRMFKTNVSEYPTVQILCFVIDKASEIRGVPVLIINSKMADLSICGVLTVCLNAIYAIKNGSLCSVLENATMANKNNSSFFKNFDDYELCYKVLEHYLAAVHTYEFIE